MFHDVPVSQGNPAGPDTREAPQVPGRRRWPVIAALGITQIFAWGATFYLPAVLAAPIVADTGWPMPWVIGALSIGLLVAGLISPRTGETIGRYGGRPVLVVACVLLALGLAILGLAPSLPVFVGGWLVLGIGMGTGLYDAAFATLGRLYGTAARSAITTLTLWGGFASTVCWPLSAVLVGHVGWRGTCFAYAAILLGICLPLMVFVLPSEPAKPVQAKAAGAVAVGPLAPAERRAFHLLAVVFIVGGIITSVILVHLMTLLQARGLTLAAAVSLGALIGPSQVSARIVEMATAGRHHPIWTLTAALVLVAIGLVLLAVGYHIIALSLILYGAGNGIYSIARGTLPLVLFGPGRYAPMMGRLAQPNLIAQALAPSLGAVVLVHGGAGMTFTMLMGLALLNVVLVAALWVSIAAAGRPGAP